jgi:dTDP-4-amino-4,6-dideoxygalactose transaminase
MINVLQPTLSEKTIQAVAEALRGQWWSFGDKVYEFEKKFADKVGAKYAIATNSCTSALDLCLKAYGIRGGELITTASTFVSDAIVGEWNLMDVTFADIDEDSFCLNPRTLHVTDQTQAIIAVDSHGRLADIEGIRKKFKGLIIEDAAHAMYTPGVGKYADITVWSFQAVKTMPMWDGGMITTNDEKIYTRLRKMTWLGVEKSTFDRAENKRYTWDYDITQADGIKAYMTNIQAVVGLGQLERIDEMTAKRRAIQTVYNEAFRSMSQIRIPQYSHTVQYYTMKCEMRDALSEYLALKNIITSVHFKPLSEMTYWKKAVKRPLPVTDKVWKELLTLPCHDALSWKDVNYVIEAVKEFYQ